MTSFNQLRFRQKIRISFGVLITFAVLNLSVLGAVVAVFFQQMEHQQKVGLVLSEVEKTRLLVSRYISAPSREAAERVFSNMATTQSDLEMSQHALEPQQLQTMHSLLNEFRLYFQKYVAEADQKAALGSQLNALGQRLARKFNEVHVTPHGQSSQRLLDELEFQIQSFQLSGRVTSLEKQIPSTEALAGIRQALDRLRARSETDAATPQTGLVLFRIENDARDFVASQETYWHYQRLALKTEIALFGVADRIQQTVTSIGADAVQRSRERTLWAVAVTSTLFVISMAIAAVMSRRLGLAIVRPVQALVEVTLQIARGNLQARAETDVQDEIGELAQAINQMALRLTESRADLLDKQHALQQSRDSLEQRIQARTQELFAANQSLTDQIHERTKAQALVRQIMDTAPMSIFLVDMNGRITQANNTMVSMFGYPMDELIGKEYVTLVDGSGQDIGHQKVSAMMNSATAILDLDIKYCRANGEEFWGHINGQPICGAQGEKLGLVGVIADITAQREHQHQLEKMAHFDALTGLPNRLLLADRLGQAMRQCQRSENLLAVAYLDLDGFKDINDSYGHDVGDNLLVMLATKMKDVLRDCDTLARIGGDEFIAVLVDLQAAEDCAILLKRLLQAVASPTAVLTSHGRRDLQLSVSIGATLFPSDSSDSDLLIRHADQAMYLAKQLGKNRFHMFDVVQDQAIKSHQESLEDIRRALLNHELVLFYQPKVNMKTGAVTGVEALIRWQHPRRGLLAPGAFLPATEGNLISVQIGEWVIAGALAQMRDWHAQGLDLPVSVNISGFELQQADFSHRLEQLLAQHPTVPVHWLELEVLETSALEDMVKVGEAMNACHVMQVQFALDDFGTGYSSLTYLKRLPADTLKIDQSFVRDILDDPGDLAIVNGVIGLAKSFGRKVIAEGVETRRHADRLLSMGCELAQGYGIARPMPAAEVPDWVSNWQRSPNWTA